MSDETNKPTDETELPDEETLEEEPLEEEKEDLEEIAHSVPAPDEYPEGQSAEMQDRLDQMEDPNGIDKATVTALDTSEEISKAAPVQAFGDTVTAIEEAIESIGGVSEESQHEAMGEHHHSDTTVVFGRELPVDIYTAVFGALAVLTVIEVVIAEIITADILSIPLLLGIAIAKAALVVLFYMHLNTDSRIFALTLAIPVGIALLSILFLIGAPPTGY